MSDEQPLVTMLDALLRSDWLHGVVVHRPGCQGASTPSYPESKAKPRRLTLYVVCDWLYDAV